MRVLLSCVSQRNLSTCFFRNDASNGTVTAVGEVSQILSRLSKNMNPVSLCRSKTCLIINRLKNNDNVRELFNAQFSNPVSLVRFVSG